MTSRSLKVFYWITFGLSIFILQLNVGLGLIAMGVVIVPVLILHVLNGLRLDKVKDHAFVIILSAINLLLFALIRPDGVHTINDNGLSSVLDIFGLHGGYDRAYENHYFIGSVGLLFIQTIIDVMLMSLILKQSRK